jgi:phosphatidylinositol alpha-1,6-mannosyltransferase
LIFGDIAVAQSAWTKQKFEEAFAAEGTKAPPLFVIPPPAPTISRPPRSALLGARKRFGCDESQPLFLYPGDLEVSRGAETVVSLAARLSESMPDARIVIAYRDKTPRAKERAAELARDADSDVVRFECNVPDIHALVAASTAILFPVDDLYGKVDLPIVLLEAMGMGTPVLALNDGPLASLHGARLLPDEPDAWLAAMAAMAGDPGAREAQIEAGRRAISEHYDPRLVAESYAKLYEQLLG